MSFAENHPEVKGIFDPDHPLEPMTTEAGKVVEKAKHNQAIRDYAFLGPARSMHKLLKRYTDLAPNDPSALTLSIDSIKLWSRQYDWQRRVAAWDIQEADRDMLEWEERKRALREQDWAQGGDLRDKVAQFLEQLPRFLQDSVSEREETLADGTKLRTRVITVGLNTNLTQIANALIQASKLQRLATDEPTENVRLSGAALDSLIASELARLAHSGEAGAPDEAPPEEPAD